MRWVWNLPSHSILSMRSNHYGSIPRTSRWSRSRSWGIQVAFPLFCESISICNRLFQVWASGARRTGNPMSLHSFHVCRNRWRSDVSRQASSLVCLWGLVIPFVGTAAPRYWLGGLGYLSQGRRCKSLWYPQTLSIYHTARFGGLGLAVVEPVLGYPIPWYYLQGLCSILPGRDHRQGHRRTFYCMLVDLLSRRIQLRFLGVLALLDQHIKVIWYLLDGHWGFWLQSLFPLISVFG